jgi:HK97 family phage prohead protease
MSHETIEQRFLAPADRSLAPVVKRCVECGGTCGGKKKDAAPAKNKIVGYAATFQTRSQDLGGFQETIQPGAFKGVLKRAASGDPAHDVVALWNHDPNLLLGRLSSGTLTLVEDSRGLRYEITPPDWAHGYVESVSRGDVTGSSFSFSVNKRSEQWSPGDKGAVPLRSISDIDRLVDVGPVVFPAYLSTESKVSQRAIAMARQLRAAAVPAFGSEASIARAKAALTRIASRNCGTGAGGFQPGNKCAKGGEGGEPEKKNFVDSHPYDAAREAEIKNGSDHSFQNHAGDAGSGLTADRHRLHRKIIDTIVPQSAKKPEGRSPILHILGGGPASGKSTMLKKGGLEIEPGAVEINPDTIKEMLPEYNELLDAGSKDAARFVHDESSAIGGLALKIAESRGLDIVLDGTGDGKMENLQAKLDRARELGYTIKAHYASNSLENARIGAEGRYKNTGRWVPEDVVTDTHRMVSQVFPAALKQNMFDEAQLYDTNIKGTARPVLSYTKNGGTTVHDQGLWEDFLAKGK